MLLHTSCEFRFTLEYPTPFILMLRVRTGGQQWVVSEEYRLSPSVSAFECIDDYHNLCQRLVAPPGDFSIYTSATVTTPDAISSVVGGALVDIQNLPDNILKYLLPSCFTLPPNGSGA